MAVNTRGLRQGSVVAILATRDGRYYNLGYTPEQAQIAGLGWTWMDVPRQGLKKLSYLGAPNSKTLTFTTRMVTRRGNVLAQLRAFETLASLGMVVRTINLSGTEGGWWRITNLTYTIDKRSPDQQTQQATVNWVLEEAILDDSPGIGRTKVTPVRSTTARRYTVRAGDTLYSIAQMQLGDGTRWSEIASLNNLAFRNSSDAGQPASNPGGIDPGQVLKIPAR